jgi:hypothetical protein
MKRTAGESVATARAAGLWLRCFLSGMTWMLLCLSGADSFAAQVDIPGPERLTHVEGYIVNPEGNPVADVEVALERDGKVAFRTQTDKSGAFRFGHASGSYVFRVKRTQYAPAMREIVVTDEIVTNLERKKLYVILGPGQCEDACSSVLTSKREFDRAIRQRRKH